MSSHCCWTSLLCSFSWPNSGNSITCLRNPELRTTCFSQSRGAKILSTLKKLLYYLFLLFTWPANFFPSRACSDPRSFVQPKWTWNCNSVNWLSPKGPPVSSAPSPLLIVSWGAWPLFSSSPVTRPLALSNAILRGLKLLHTRLLVLIFIGDWWSWPQSGHLLYQSVGPSTIVNYKKAINNSNRTSCRPIQSVIIRVINKHQTTA